MKRAVRGPHIQTVQEYYKNQISPSFVRQQLILPHLPSLKLSRGVTRGVRAPADRDASPPASSARSRQR